LGGKEAGEIGESTGDCLNGLKPRKFNEILLFIVADKLKRKEESDSGQKNESG